VEDGKGAAREAVPARRRRRRRRGRRHGAVGRVRRLGQRVRDCPEARGRGRAGGDADGELEGHALLEDVNVGPVRQGEADGGGGHGGAEDAEEAAEAEDGEEVAVGLEAGADLAGDGVGAGGEVGGAEEPGVGGELGEELEGLGGY
jgi:hypothetical protein